MLSSQEPKITAIVAAYNVEYYIEETLESLLNQTYTNIDILVYDDGSTDDTQNLLKKYESDYTNVTVIFQENRGIARTRNRGICEAEGDYITFVDGDDVLPLNAYEKMVTSLVSSNSDMVSGFVQHINSTKKYPSGLFKVAIRDTVKNTNIRQHPELVYETTVWNKMYRRKFLLDENILFPVDKAFAEDIPFTMSVHLQAKSVDIITDTVYLWRIRDRGDVSATQDRSNLDFFDQRIEMLLMARQQIMSYSDTANVLHEFDFKLFDHDLNIYLKMFENRSRKFLLDFHKRVIRLVRETTIDSLDEMPIGKQIYYRAFLNAEFDTYRKYVNLAEKNVPVVLQNNSFIFEDSTVPQKIKNALNFEKGFQAHHLLTSIRKNEDTDIITISGEWYLEGFKNIKPSQERIFLEILNIDNNLLVPVEVTRRKRKERVNWRYITRYDAFDVKFNVNEVVQKIGVGRWKFNFINELGSSRIAAYIGNPITARRQKLSYQDETISINSHYNSNWELVFNVNNLVNSNHDAFIHIQCQNIEMIPSGIKLFFEADRKLTNASVVVKQENDDKPIPVQVYDDTRYIVNIPLIGDSGNFAFNKRWLLSIESEDEQSLLVNRFSLEVPHELNVLHLTNTHNNHLEVLVAERCINVKKVILQKNYLKIAIDVDDKIRGVVAKSQKYTKQLPFLQKNGTIKVQLQDRLGDFVLEDDIYDFYIETSDGQALLKINYDDTWQARTSFRYKRHNIWKSRMNTLRIRSRTIWSGFFDKTARRRKFTEWVLYPIMRLLPLQKKTWVFDSYWAGKFTSNEKAMYEYLEKAHPSMKLIWIFNDPNTKITGKGIKVRQYSAKYWWYISRAKYMIQNTNFPQRYIKRAGQIEVETLHGTFMKTMGFDEPNFKFASRWTQERFADRISRWDFLVSPSKFMDKTAPNAFQYKKRILHTGFPRNDRLVNENNFQHIDMLKKKLQLPLDKEIVLYAPTYRQTNSFDFEIDLNDYVKKLGDRQILLVRLHYFIASQLDLSAYKNVVFDMSGYPEIEDLYIISDVLITDYSSVMFDYSLLNRPMIFYAYDLDWYINPKNRGTYLDYVNVVPGPIVRTHDDLIDKLSNISDLTTDGKEKREEFIAEFATYGREGNAAQQVVETVLNTTVSPTEQAVKPYALRDSFWKALQVKDILATALLYYSRHQKRQNNIVFFSSFNGTQISESPLAIYNQMKKRFPNYHLVWLAKDDDIATKYKKKGYDVASMARITTMKRLARAKYLVVNYELPLSWNFSDDVIIMQTGRGLSQKKRGADIGKVLTSGMTRNNYVNRVMRDASRWTYVLTNSSTALDQYQSGYQLEPEQVLATGLPRNDLLISEKNNDILKSRKRVEFGIAIDKTIILYEPTWRDADEIRHGHYSAKLRLDLKLLKEHFNDDVQIIIKWHHHIEEYPKLPDEIDDFALDVSYVNNMSDLYLISDIYITDYSAGLFDFVLLERPVLQFVPDEESFIDGIGIDDTAVTTLTKYKHTDDICREIELLINDPKYLAVAREKSRSIAQCYATWDDGKSTTRAIDVLLHGAEASWQNREIASEVIIPEIGTVIWQFVNNEFISSGIISEKNTFNINNIREKRQNLQNRVVDGPYYQINHSPEQWILKED